MSQDTIWTAILEIHHLTNPNTGQSISDVLQDDVLHTDGALLAYAKEDLVELGILGAHATVLIAELNKFRPDPSGALRSDVETKLDDLLDGVAALQVSVGRLTSLTTYHVWSAASTRYDDRSVLQDVEAALGGRRCCISDARNEAPPANWPTPKERRDTAFVRPGHLWPRTKAAQMVMDSMIGREGGYPGQFELNGVRNVLMMRFDIEHAFDNKYIVIYPTDFYLNALKVAVLHEGVDEVVKREVSGMFTVRKKGEVVQAGEKRWDSFRLSVREFHGAQVTLAEMKTDESDELDQVMPYRRVLGFHIARAVAEARNCEWPVPADVDLDNLETLSDVLRGASRAGSVDPPVDAERATAEVKPR